MNNELTNKYLNSINHDFFEPLNLDSEQASNNEITEEHKCLRVSNGAFSLTQTPSTGPYINEVDPPLQLGISIEVNQELIDNPEKEFEALLNNDPTIKKSSD
jgi:hypothetical protein